MNHPPPLPPLSNSSRVAAAFVLAIGMASLGYQMGAPSKIIASAHLRPETQGEPAGRQVVYSNTFAASAEAANIRSQPSMLEASEQPPPAGKTKMANSGVSANAPYSHVLESTAASRPIPHTLQAASALQQPQWPLVMLDMDLNALGLSNEQQAMVARLRDQFIAEVGGQNQNPADPNYLKRWQQAAPAMDEILRAQVGWTAFNAYTVANARSQAAQ